MKKFTLFCLFLILTLPLFSQNANPAEATDTVNELHLWHLYPGYIILKTGDTMHGYVMLGNLLYNQMKALFFKYKEDKKATQKFRPNDILGYKTGPRSYDAFKYRPSMAERSGYHFFMKVLSGPITVYRWYYEPQARTQQRVEINEDNILLSKIDLSFSEFDLKYFEIGRKLGGKPFGLDMALNFKKAMSKLVSDDAELSKKIREKAPGYRLPDQMKIIREYNQWYLSQHHR